MEEIFSAEFSSFIFLKSGRLVPFSFFSSATFSVAAFLTFFASPVTMPPTSVSLRGVFGASVEVARWRPRIHGRRTWSDSLEGWPAGPLIAWWRPDKIKGRPGWPPIKSRWRTWSEVKRRSVRWLSWREDGRGDPAMPTHCQVCGTIHWQCDNSLWLTPLFAVIWPEGRHWPAKFFLYHRRLGWWQSFILLGKAPFHQIQVAQFLHLFCGTASHEQRLRFSRHIDTAETCVCSERQSWNQNPGFFEIGRNLEDLHLPKNYINCKETRFKSCWARCSCFGVYHQ